MKLKFTGFRDEMLRMNKDVRKVASSEKAQKLKKRLLCIGIPILAVGVIGLATCLILFSCMDPFSSIHNVVFALCIPFGLCSMVGFILTAIGLGVSITKYTSGLVDDTVGNNCPNCKEVIEDDQSFCPNCGTQVKNVCPKCQTVNDSSSKFCKNCGRELKSDNFQE